MENPLDYLKNIAIERVKEKGEDFAGHYVEYGLWSNPFTSHDEPLHANFDFLFESNKEEISKFVGLIVDSLTGKGGDIALIAPVGYGSRSFINFFKYFLRMIENEEHSLQLKIIKDKLDRIVDVDSCNFTPSVRNQIRKDIAEGLQKSKTMLITSYFCDKHLPLRSKNNKFNESTIDTYRKILEFDSLSSDKIIFFSPWPATAWQYSVSESPMLKEIYEDILIFKHYSKEQIINMLIRRIIFFKLRDKESPVNSKEILKIICDYAGYIPRFSIEFAFVILEKICNKKVTFNKKNVLKLIKDIGPSHEEIKKNLHELIPPPKKWHKKENTIKIILKIIIQLGGNHITATEISKFMEKSRPAISRYLYELEAKKIIVKSDKIKEDERKVPYTLPDFSRSIFEKEFIIPEIEKELK